MAHLVEDITKFFVFEDIDIDNYHFKLYSKGCVIFFFAGSMVGVMSQYFGEPIQCDFKGVDTETAKDYCWIHGSSYIPPQYQRHMKCIADLEGVDRKEDAPDTSYYQWVTFMMLIQAGLFMLPPRIWKSLEGGLIESFGMEGKSVVMLTDEAKYEDGVVMTVVIEKFVKYFSMVLHHNQAYFAYFVSCEVANMLLLFFNFWMTDQFLQGRFRYYGYQVIEYYQMNDTVRRGSVNPFCAAFPKEISCDVPTVGASGREQWHNGLCVLSQNVINEKIYLALWFYLVFTMCCCLCFMFYRIATIFIEPFRFYLIFHRIGHRYDTEIRNSLKYVLTKCYIGDWFVLQQLSRNVNVYFFREFIKELRSAMRTQPKMSMRDCNFDYDKVRQSFSAETRIDMPGFPPPPGVGGASSGAGPSGSGTPGGGGSGSDTDEPEKEKSRYLLRIEHEQRLMPGMRGRRGRGRGRGRGKGRGKGRKH